MALFHLAKITPTKAELIAEWAPTQPWGPAADVPVEVIGDSAYTIDCFVKEWHVRWEQNGWRNSSGKSVANRDEWERAFAAWRARSAETAWDRVRGHLKGTHPWNDLADRLAVEAKRRS